MAKNLRTSIKQSIKASSKASLTGGNVFGTSPLDLRFALQKTLDPRITFTRASTGTYVGSDGVLQTATTNEARFDHNPTTGESLGLLVEEARTNLVTWSQYLSNSDWAKAAATIVSTAVASPIQGVNYQKIEATSANTTVGVTSIAVTAATQQRAVSFFAQPLGNISRLLVVVQGADARININLVDGTFTTNATATGSTVSVLGQRFSVSTPTLTLATGVRFFLKRTGETDTNTTTTIAIGEGLYLTGAQMEAGAFATSYIPTTTATATRAADVASITGTNFSSWYNQTEGTVFSDCLSTFSTTQVLVNIAATAAITATSAISLSSNLTSSQKRVRVRDAASDDQASLALGASSSGSRTRIAAAIKANDFAASLDGGTAVTDTSGTVPTVVLMEIGCAPTGVTLGTQLHRRLTYWPVGLADTTLQSITAP
jgi:hypothetical protein